MRPRKRFSTVFAIFRNIPWDCITKFTFVIARNFLVTGRAFADRRSTAFAAKRDILLRMSMETAIY